MQLLCHLKPDLHFGGMYIYINGRWVNRKMQNKKREFMLHKVSSVALFHCPDQCVIPYISSIHIGGFKISVGTVQFRPAQIAFHSKSFFL